MYVLLFFDPPTAVLAAVPKAYWFFVISAGTSLGGITIWTSMLVDLEALELKTCNGNLVEKHFNVVVLFIGFLVAVSFSSASLHLATPTSMFIQDVKAAVQAAEEFDAARTRYRLVSENMAGAPLWTWYGDIESYDRKRLLWSTSFLTGGATLCHYAMVKAQFGAYKLTFVAGHVIAAMLISVICTSFGMFIVTQVSAKENLEKMKVRMELRIIASVVIASAVNWLHFESMESAHYHYTADKKDAFTYGWGKDINADLKAYHLCIISLSVAVAQLAACQHFSSVLYKQSQEAIKKATNKLPDNVQEVLDKIHARIVGLDDGEVASYIPELAKKSTTHAEMTDSAATYDTPTSQKADASLFGIALCDVGTGKVFMAGDARATASIQSVCKPFMYALAMTDSGRATVDRLIGEEPSGKSFNELAIDEDNRAMNPLINTGALVTASLIKGEDPEDRYKRFERLLRKAAYEPSEIHMNQEVYESETATNQKNREIVESLVEYAIVAQEDAETSLDAYTQICSMNTTAADLAVAAACVAGSGKHPKTGDKVLSPALATKLVSTMMSCGMYNGAGKWMVDVGIPAKSGVSGMLMCVVPGVCGIGIYSPKLDEHGNSTRGVLVAEALSKDLHLHVLKEGEDGDQFELASCCSCDSDASKLGANGPRASRDKKPKPKNKFKVQPEIMSAPNLNPLRDSRASRSFKSMPRPSRSSLGSLCDDDDAGPGDVPAGAELRPAEPRDVPSGFEVRPAENSTDIETPL